MREPSRLNPGDFRALFGEFKLDENGAVRFASSVPANAAECHLIVHPWQEEDGLIQIAGGEVYFY